MLHVSNKDKVYIYMYYVFISIYAKTKLTQNSNWNDLLACTCTNNHFNSYTLKNSVTVTSFKQQKL